MNAVDLERQQEQNVHLTQRHGFDPKDIHCVGKNVVECHKKDALESINGEGEVVPPDGGWGWMVVLASFLAHVIADGCGFSFGVLFSELLDVFGETKGRTAWVGSLFVSVPAICGPIASALTNRYGCRVTTILGGLIAGIGCFFSAYATSIGELCITFGLIAGFGLSLVFVPTVVIVAFYFERKRAFATGIAVAGSGIGTVIFAPLTEFLIDRYQWRGALTITSAILLNIVVCGALFRPLEPPRRSYSPNASKSKPNLHLPPPPYPANNKSMPNRSQELGSALSRRCRYLLLKYRTNPCSNNKCAQLDEQQDKEPNKTLGCIKRKIAVNSDRLSGEESGNDVKAPDNIQHRFSLIRVENMKIGDVKYDIKETDEIKMFVSHSQPEFTLYCQLDSSNDITNNNEEIPQLNNEAISPIGLQSICSVTDNDASIVIPVIESANGDLNRKLNEVEGIEGLSVEGRTIRSVSISHTLMNRDRNLSPVPIQTKLSISAPDELCVNNNNKNSNCCRSTDKTPMSSLTSVLHALVSRKSSCQLQISRECTDDRDSLDMFAEGRRFSDRGVYLRRRDMVHRGSLLKAGYFFNVKERSASCPDFIASSGRQRSKSWKQRLLRIGPMEAVRYLAKVIDLSMFRSAVFNYFCAHTVLLYISYDIPYVYGPVRAANLGMSDSRASLLVSIIGLFSTVGQVLMGYLGDRTYVDILTFYNTMTSIAGMVTLLMPLAISFVSLSTLCAAYGFFISANFALTTVILVDLLGMEQLTNSFGIVSLAQGVANLVGPPLAGWISDATSSFDAAFYCSGCIICLSGFMLFAAPWLAQCDKVKKDLYSRSGVVHLLTPSKNISGNSEGAVGLTVFLETGN